MQLVMFSIQLCSIPVENVRNRNWFRAQTDPGPEGRDLPR